MSFSKCFDHIFLLFGVGILLGCHRSDVKPETISSATIISFQVNPYGNWAIGYSKSTSLDLNDFQSCNFPDTVRPVPLWHPGVGPGNYYPYTGQNRDSVVTADSSRRWALRPGEIAMEGSSTGQYALLRFTVPADGHYRVKALFEGVHIGGSTTDVHVMYNATHLFDDVIDGYGGDSTFHALFGSHPSTGYEASLNLKKNDVLTFAVGYGPNRTYFNDTTGLLLLIERT